MFDERKKKVLSIFTNFFVIDISINCGFILKVNFKQKNYA